MKGQRLPLDIISTLPPTIIETILCLLPIRDAVRTSILSRKWRYNWVNIPQLEFHEGQLFKVSANERYNLFYKIVYQVLLVHHGPILEFALSMSTIESCSEIDQIILHLLRNNTVKKLTLDLDYCAGYKLLSSFFSLKQLTHLTLYGCELLPPSTFSGFGNLTTLVLGYIKTTTKMLLHLITNCPLLKSFTLIYYDDYVLTEGDSTIIQLLECLHAIEHLCMKGNVIECFAKGGFPQKLPISLANLKYLEFLEPYMSKNELSFAFLLMRSSPKLEKIKIMIDNYDRSRELKQVIKLEDYSNVWFDHLTELEIENFGYLMYELEFLKLILVKSPMLKRVHIVLDDDVSIEEELKMLRILLRLPRASPVEIIVSRPRE